MTRLLILVEGQSEEIFVKQTLTPYLAEREVYVASPVVLTTRRIPSGGGYRGGITSWNQVLKDIMPLTRDSDAWVTTVIDFYGLPDDFPRPSASSVDPQENVKNYEEEFASKIRHTRFIPFLSLHEFEAWVFCAPKVIAEHFGAAQLEGQVRDIVEKAGGPELINHGQSTHPKARLRSLYSRYKETSDGATLLHKIGISVIRSWCPHFDQWLSRLEALVHL